MQAAASAYLMPFGDRVIEAPPTLAILPKFCDGFCIGGISFFRIPDFPHSLRRGFFASLARIGENLRLGLSLSVLASKVERAS